MPTSWEEFVSSALIGTDQQKLPSFRTDDNEGNVGILLQKLQSVQGKSKESVFLASVGVLALHRKAGLMPGKLQTSAIEPCQPESLALCKEIGISRFKMLFENYERSLLPTWLGACAAAGRRVPSAAIPLLLDLARAKPEFRPLVAPVIGNLGNWLANINPNWSYVLAYNSEVQDVSELETKFETGSPEERLNALIELRRLDPARALTLLQTTWDSELPAQKVSFLKVAAENVSMADEPFLEEIALSDKRKEVRQQAASTLGKLKESRYSQRMLVRAIELIALEDGKITIRYPKESDKEMIRDGIDKSSQPETIEDKIQRFIQIIRVVPPSVWEAKLRMPPESILRDQPFDELHRRSLLQAWAQSSIFHADKKWCMAFLSSKHGSLLQFSNTDSMTPELREELILNMMRNNGGRLVTPQNTYHQPISSAILNCNHEWSESFARTLMPEIIRGARTCGSAQYIFKNMGAFFPVKLAKDMETACKNAGPEIMELADPFLTVLTFKTELYSALL